MFWRVISFYRKLEIQLDSINASLSANSSIGQGKGKFGTRFNAFV